jgi:hypothetical protein
LVAVVVGNIEVVVPLPAVGNVPTGCRAVLAIYAVDDVFAARIDPVEILPLAVLLVLGRRRILRIV